MREDLAIIVLAAGKGTRMKQEGPKVLIESHSGSLIEVLLSSLNDIAHKKLVIVTGYKHQLVEAHIQNVKKKYTNIDKLSFAKQEEQLGTGHAVKSALPELKNFSGKVLIVYGDTPIIKAATLQSLINFHDEEQNTISILSLSSNNNHYGRIIRNKENEVTNITEFKDCTTLEKQISETNTGIYVVDAAFLAPALEKVENNNSQKEYYLTDIVSIAVSEGQKVDCLATNSVAECCGVNDIQDLNIVNAEINRRKINQLIEEGVVFTLPETCLVSNQTEIAAGVVVGPNCQFLGKNKIGVATVIEGNSLIIDSEVGENNLIKLSSRIEQAKIANNCMIGPFAHLRPESVLADDVKVGNFVETKKATLAKGAKASHLTYLGDATVGEDANIGAGTITCNYDGKNKFPTVIGKDAFIGSNTALVAPVEIGENVLIGAGSVITKDVSNNQLALSRVEQKSINRKK